MKNQSIIYTIGHSIHSSESFLELLKKYQINALVDVRSVPFSKFNTQFNQQTFKSFLKENGIHYLYFGKEMGARMEDLKLFDEFDQLDFKKVRNSSGFKKAIQRLKNGLEKNLQIALMSSKAEPISCHRFAMIAPALTAEGVEVKHILPDGKSISQKELENQMIMEYANELPQVDMFNPQINEEKRLQKAYELKNREIGYILRKT